MPEHKSGGSDFSLHNRYRSVFADCFILKSDRDLHVSSFRLWTQASRLLG